MISHDPDGLQSPAISSPIASPRSPVLAPADARKRKRGAATDDDEERISAARRGEEEEEKPTSKRAAKKRKRAANGNKDNNNKEAYDEALDVEAGINRAIAHMDPQLLADHIAQRNKRFNADLSTVELEDLRIPSSVIVDSSSWRGERNLEHLPDFLDRFHSSNSKTLALSEAPRDKGAPHTLVVTGAGLRAADLTRALRKFQTKEAKVEKLFAKHIKLKEAIDQVKKSRICIGVGTPQRITDLLEDGALRWKHIRKIVVDASHIDVKKRGVLDMRETHVPLMTLLCRKEFTQRYSASKDGLELLFY